MYEVKREATEIDEVLNICAEQGEKGGSKYPNVSYEQGVLEGIAWLVGHIIDPPVERD